MSWQMLITRHKTGSKLDQQQMRGKPGKCMYNSGRSADDPQDYVWYKKEYYAKSVEKITAR